TVSVFRLIASEDKMGGRAGMTHGQDMRVDIGDMIGPCGNVYGPPGPLRCVHDEVDL
ncbi:hypothetical protein GE061_004973, partial [Apolygus lucorum]